MEGEHLRTAFRTRPAEKYPRGTRRSGTHDRSGTGKLKQAAGNSFRGSLPQDSKSDDGPKKIVLLSARISATLLDQIHYMLSKIRDNVQIVLPGSPEWNNLILEKPEDTFIFTIMFPRYPNILITEIAALHKAGFEIGLMTNSMLSPLIPHSSYYIEVPVSSTSIFDCYGTATVLLNYLVRDIAGQIENLEERLNRLETYEKENDTYYRI